MVPALAASAVTVVVLPLVRGNAIARAIRNWEGVSCNMTITKLAVQPCSATERAAAAVDLFQGGVDKLWFQPAVTTDACRNCVL